MSWENRAGSRRKYYCRSIRVDGRVTREYIGRAADPVVQFIAQGDALGRAAAAAAVADVRAEQTRFRELEPQLRNLADRVQEMEEIYLLTLGYRRSEGGWQPVQYKNKNRPMNNLGDGDERPTRELFQHLSRQANRGDRKAADRLRQILRENPDIWRSIGDLARHAEQSLIDLIARGNLVLGESVRLKVEEMRKSLLAEATDETLEKLLIDEVVVANTALGDA